MFKLISGKPRLAWYPKKASTAFNNGDLVYPDGSGAIQPADSTSGNHLGIILKDVAATDDDYASTTLVPLQELGEDDIFEATVTGTLTAAMVGSFYDLSDAHTVNVGAQSKKVVLCVGYISATKGLFKINARAADFYVATS
jgi:hypothetical protein